MQTLSDEMFTVIKAGTALQTAVYDLLNCDINDHTAIEREISAMETIHKELGSAIKKIRKNET